MEYIQRNYRVKREQDKKVKKAAKKYKTHKHPKGSESEVIRRLIDTHLVN